MMLELKLALHNRRCQNCHRWFATESEHTWRCGMCAQDRIDQLNLEVARLERSNAALRGVINRKPRRRRAS